MNVLKATIVGIAGAALMSTSAQAVENTQENYCDYIAQFSEYVMVSRQVGLRRGSLRDFPSDMTRYEHRIIDHAYQAYGNAGDNIQQVISHYRQVNKRECHQYFSKLITNGWVSWDAMNEWYNSDMAD